MKNCMDVAALGELLVDFTCNGTSTQGNPFYEANPGGAPATCWPAPGTQVPFCSENSAERQCGRWDSGSTSPAERVKVLIWACLFRREERLLLV